MNSFALLSVVVVSTIEAVYLTAEAEAEYWDHDDLMIAS